MHTTIIDQAAASRHLDDDSWLFVDCRYSIRELDWGDREYGESHIPGAVYAHLYRDLSGPAIRGRTGRHPLPAPEAIVRTFSGWGIGTDTQVVAYDDSTGAMAAARLWWLLKWAGHDAVSVLDGGLKKWKAAGHPCAGGPVKRPDGRFVPRFRQEMAMDAGQVLQAAGNSAWIVLDARAADRFHGLNEIIDPVAGHITGACSAPYGDNLTEDGSLKPVNELRARLDTLAGTRDCDHTVVYCGSGVTAAHLALAFAHAGKGIPRLYPGSWSDWITDPGRPIAK